MSSFTRFVKTLCSVVSRRARCLWSVRRCEVVERLRPALERRPQPAKQRCELLVRLLVGFATRVVPLARNIDRLPCSDLDATQDQRAVRLAEHVQFGLT